MTGALDLVPIYSEPSDSTSYLVAKADSTEAIIIDPIPMTTSMYSSILERKWNITTVLITHLESYMNHALNTLGKIFSFEIVSGAIELLGARCRVPDEQAPMNLSGLEVRAINTLSHSRESCIYLIDRICFSGSIIQAGALGETPNSFAEQLLIATVKDYLFEGGEDYVLLPSVGPPSTIAAEQRDTPFFNDKFIDA